MASTAENGRQGNPLKLQEGNKQDLILYISSQRTAASRLPPAMLSTAKTGAVWIREEGNIRSHIYERLILVGGAYLGGRCDVCHMKNQ